MSDENIEQKAAQMGWFPKDQYRGDPAGWVDAAEFVRRGEQVLPILRAREQRTAQENQQLRQELQSTRQLLEETRAAVSDLKKFNDGVALDRAKGQKDTLLGQIAEAKRSGDVQREVQLQDQLNQTNTAIREAEAKQNEPPKTTQQQPPPNPNQDPVFMAWRQENPWFGTNIRKTALANGIAAEMRQNPEFAQLPQREFLNKVADEVAKELGGNGRRQAPSRVEGGGSSSVQGGGSSSGSRSYADLPQDAREACDKYAKKMVGPTKAFKSEAEWQKHYVNQYFSE